MRRPARSFIGPDANTCRCDASWPRKANWVKMRPSAAAMSSWNQESPSRMNPATAPPSPTSSRQKTVM
jgi:hypothetical protein